MTEQDWLVCTDPQRMLRFLLGTTYPRVQDIEAFPHCKGSDRKLRLFACACYARIRHLLPNAIARAAVEVAEQFADGFATAAELQQAEPQVWEPINALEGRWRASTGAERDALLPTHEALALALQVVRRQAPKAAYFASSNAYLTAASIAATGAASSDNRFAASMLAEERAQAELLRCIFGNLFQAVTVTPDVLEWNDGTAGLIATAIYDDRTFDHLPMLADALEEAGCHEAEMLAHLRQPGPHVRGCWVVDVILGKE